MKLFLFTILAFAADKEMNLEIPPFWDDERKVKMERMAIAVNQEGLVETCDFSGGSVVVLKQEGGQVKFRTKKKTGCGTIVMPAEDFENLKSENAQKTTRELDQKQKQFEAQLDQDLAKVLKSRGEHCLPKGQGLEMGKVYKLQGKLYRYHDGTRVRNLGGGHCQAEADSLMEMVGFDRTGQFAVAVFRRAKDSKGVVPEGSDNKQAKVCDEDAKVVVPVEKLRNYFSFAEASTSERLAVTGVMAMFKKSPRTCDPAEVGNEAFVSTSRQGKQGPSGSTGRVVEEENTPGNTTNVQ
jgi:hypothetical protein